MGIRRVVLLADDEPDLRTLIHTVLDKEGYEVLAASNGHEALELSRAHEGTIDLLLTDVAMPHMDGISAYHQINAERAGIKVLFISGGIPDSLTLPDGLPFLPKPFITLDPLCSKVRELLESPSPERSAAAGT